MKKSIPKFQEREGNEKIFSQDLGTGMRRFHSREQPGMGITAHPHLPLMLQTLQELRKLPFTSYLESQV